MRSGTNSTTNSFWYAAREYDWESELYYNRARYYDPWIGRFISEDPAGLTDGINLYTYADNDPVNGGDPMGLWTLHWGIKWRHPWRDVFRWGPAIAFTVVTAGAGFGAAVETFSATAFGAAVQAGAESLITHGDFGAAFMRNWGMSTLPFIYAGIVDLYGGGMNAYARNIMQGAVEVKHGKGAITLGSATLFAGNTARTSIPSSLASVGQHEFGHVVQLLAMSAFHGFAGAGPWVTYLGLGGAGLLGQLKDQGLLGGVVGCAWEGLSTIAGSWGKTASCY